MTSLPNVLSIGAGLHTPIFSPIGFLVARLVLLDRAVETFLPVCRVPRVTVPPTLTNIPRPGRLQEPRCITAELLQLSFPDFDPPAVQSHAGIPALPAIDLAREPPKILLFRGESIETVSEGRLDSSVQRGALYFVVEIPRVDK